MSRYAGAKSNFGSSAISSCMPFLNGFHGAHPYLVSLNSNIKPVMIPDRHDPWGYMKVNYTDQPTVRLLYEGQVGSQDQRPGTSRAYMKGAGSFKITGQVNTSSFTTSSNITGSYSATDLAVVFTKINPLEEGWVQFLPNSTGNDQAGVNLQVISVDSETTYLKDFELIHSDDESLRGTGVIWHPKYISLIRQNNPKCYRAMDIMGGHHLYAPIVRWADRIQKPPRFAGVVNQSSRYYAGATASQGAADTPIYINISVPSYVDEDHAQFCFTWPRTLVAQSNGGRPLTPKIFINGGSGINIYDPSINLDANGLSFQYSTERPDAGDLVWVTRNKLANCFIVHTAGTNPTAIPCPRETFIPVEWAVDLCNQTGTDLWYCVSVFSGDPGASTLHPYVGECADYVRSNLNSDLNCYVEYTNEAWNFAFKSSFYCTSIERIRYPSDAVNRNTIDHQYGRALARIGQVLNDTLGSDRSRFILVAGRQTGSGQTERVLSTRWCSAAESNNAANAAKNFTPIVSAHNNYWYNKRIVLPSTPKNRWIWGWCYDKAIDYASGDPVKMKAAIDWGLAGFYSQTDDDADTSTGWAKTLSNMQSSINAVSPYGIQTVCYEGGQHFTTYGSGSISFHYHQTALTNPFTTTNGSTVITVNWPGHGRTADGGTTETGKFSFCKNDKTGSNITAFNGWAANLIGSFTVLSVIDANNFTFSPNATPATASGSGGGSVSMGYYKTAPVSLFDNFAQACKDSKELAVYTRLMLADIETLANHSMAAEFQGIANRNARWGDLTDGIWGLNFNGQWDAFVEYNGGGVATAPVPTIVNFTSS